MNCYCAAYSESCSISKIYMNSCGKKSRSIANLQINVEVRLTLAMNTKIVIDEGKKASIFSAGGKGGFVISLFVLTVGLLACMNYLQGYVFDGVRSYIHGEGLWAKGQKDALIYLNRYSYSHSASDYYAFREAVNVNLGDKQARLALLASPPRLQEAQHGFLQGQNDAQDIDALIRFFLHFHDVSYVRQAIAIWIEGDEKIAELVAMGEEIRRYIETPGTPPQQLAILRERLHNLNGELVILESRFSAVLADGARWVRKTIWNASIFISLLFIAIAAIVSRQIIKGIATAEQELLISESRFRSLKDSNSIGIVSWRIDGLIDDANDFFLNMLAYTRSDLNAGKLNWQMLTPPEWRLRDQQAIDELLRSGTYLPYEKILLDKYGNPVPVYIGGASLEGNRDLGIAYVMDLCERKQAEEQMKLAATVFDASLDGILVTDATQRIVSVNRALSELMGYSEDELLGTIPKIFPSAYLSQELYRDFWQALNEKGHWQDDVVDYTKSGELVALRLSVSCVKNNAGVVTHYVAVLSDITERKAAEDRLRFIAHHDPLTGLPNRVFFDDRIEQTIKRASRNNSKFAVAFFDLDKFKPVNDLYGHKVGDKLLQIIANRLIENVRDSDTVTRLGGDEFLILLENVSDREMVNRLLKKIAAILCAPCQIEGHSIGIGVSIGASIYPEDGRDAKDLIHHADIAMYDIKKGRGKPSDRIH